VESRWSRWTGWWRAGALALAVAGCVQTVPLGPDLGPCARPANRGEPYSYGEIGIGTCLAGPADIEFFEQDGTWLAVSNADPYRNFVTGSVLVIPWDEVTAAIEQNTSSVPQRIPIHTLDAVSAAFDDDDGDEGTEGGNPFLGGLDRHGTREALLVSGRLTEGSDIRAGADELFVIDTRGLPDSIRKDNGFFLRDDPFPVVFDPDEGVTYVGNLTDHSISLVEPVDPSATVDDEEYLAFTTIDAADGRGVGSPTALDVDGSGSLLELIAVQQTARREIGNDDYELTFISGTRRLWVPVDDDGATGLIRYESGDGETYGPSGFGREVGLDATGGVETLEDLVVQGRPSLFVDASGVPSLLYARDLGEQVGIELRPSRGIAGQWDLPLPLVLGEPGEILASPSMVGLAEGLALFYGVRDDPAGPSRIERSLDPSSGLVFDAGEPVFDEAGADLADPFVLFDGRARRWRMWLTLRADDGTRSIGHAASADGETFEPPVEVFASDTSVAAPVLAIVDGRYEMWFAVASPDGWDIATATSPDGLEWTPRGVVLEDVAPPDADPPRPALQTDLQGRFRVESVNRGRFEDMVAGAGVRTDFGGFSAAVVHGHEIPNDVVVETTRDGPEAQRGLLPGSLVELDGRTLLYATAIDGPDPDDIGITPVSCRARVDEAQRIVVLERKPDGRFQQVSDDAALRSSLGLRGSQQAFAPAVVVEGDEVVMFYAVQSPAGTRLRRATSSDGLTFGGATNVGPALVEGTYDGAGRIPHAVERLDEGVRLWYTADDGTTCRIGTLSSKAGALGTFVRDSAQPVLGLGAVGAFDGEGVKDPAPVELDGETVLLYAGLLDDVWRIGIARRDGEGDDAVWRPDPDPIESLPQPAAAGLPNAFSARGTDSPAALVGPDGVEVYYAGFDGFARRVGRARLRTIGAGLPEIVGRPGFFPEPRFATAGDRIRFETRRPRSREGFPDTVIELAQQTASFSTDGEGMSSMTLDSERGFVYVTSKTSSLGVSDRLTVVDVRDDSTRTFEDTNYRDLEGVVEVDLAFGTVGGFRDLLVDPIRNQLYLTSIEPDGVAIVDLAPFVDNAEKEITVVTPEGILPLPDRARDAGAESNRTRIGGAGMALAPDGRTLIVTHFRGNGVAMFDLELGAFGEQVAWIPHVGENPHLVEIAPDGRYAVVANYVGEVEGNLASSTLAILDIDPLSASYQEVVAWIVNR